MLPIAKQEKLLQAFGRDAKKAITTIRESLEVSDVNALASVFHAMKSALANIGETEKSEAAHLLERAGLNGDMDYIFANVEAFILILQSLIPTVNAEINAVSDTDSEDIEFVKRHLSAAKLACNNYDDKSAYFAMDTVLAQPLKSRTRIFVQKMRDLLYSDSDFDGVSDGIDVFLGEIN